MAAVAMAGRGGLQKKKNDQVRCGKCGAARDYRHTV